MKLKPLQLIAGTALVAGMAFGGSQLASAQDGTSTTTTPGTEAPAATPGADRTAPADGTGKAGCDKGEGTAPADSGTTGSTTAPSAGEL